MMLALAACGLMVASTQASLVVVSNPNNMVINYHETQSGTWGGWATDTLQTAYDAGQVTLSDSGGGWSGAPEYMVDGLTSDYAVSVTSGYEMYQGNTVDFKFESSYAGGRTIGDAGQNAMRLKTNFHLDHDGFHYRLEYSTTAAPAVFQTLVEVQDTAVTEWSPRLILYDFDAGSTLVTDVDTIRYVQLDANHQGMVEEFNVTMIPEPGTMALVGLGGLAVLATRRFRI